MVTSNLNSACLTTKVNPNSKGHYGVLIRKSVAKMHCAEPIYSRSELNEKLIKMGCKPMPSRINIAA